MRYAHYKMASGIQRMFDYARMPFFGKYVMNLSESEDGSELQIGKMSVIRQRPLDISRKDVTGFRGETMKREAEKFLRKLKPDQRDLIRHVYLSCGPETERTEYQSIASSAGDLLLSGEQDSGESQGFSDGFWKECGTSIGIPIACLAIGGICKWLGHGYDVFDLKIPIELTKTKSYIDMFGDIALGTSFVLGLMEAGFLTRGTNQIVDSKRASYLERQLKNAKI